MRELYYDEPLTPQKFPDFGPGKCRYCGKCIEHPRKFYCRDMHGELYRSATATYRRVYWSTFRLTILKRDNYTCLDCGRTVSLEVHHIVPVSKGGETFDKENCRTLCDECHVPVYHRKRYQEPRPSQSYLKVK